MNKAWDTRRIKQRQRIAFQWCAKHPGHGYSWRIKDMTWTMTVRTET